MSLQTAAFIVHGLQHLRAALAAGAATGRGIVAISAPGASAYAGAGWFLELIEAGREEFPNVALTGILDCADRGGDALNALGLGISHIVFTGHSAAAARLTDIAAAKGAAILDRRPAALDLLDVADPGYAARKWCERLSSQA